MLKQPARNHHQQRANFLNSRTLGRPLFFRHQPSASSFTNLPSIVSVLPRYRVHLKSGSRLEGLLVPLHYLCIQYKQLQQKFKLLPIPFLQTPKGSFPDLFSRSKSMPDTIIFVFPMFTLRHFFFISVFHVFSFTRSFSMDRALIIKSSAYSSSHGQHVRNFLDRPSNTMMERSGLRTEPW